MHKIYGRGGSYQESTHQISPHTPISQFSSYFKSHEGEAEYQPRLACAENGDKDTGNIINAENHEKAEKYENALSVGNEEKAGKY